MRTLPLWIIICIFNMAGNPEVLELAWIVDERREKVVCAAVYYKNSI
jgi:hypothetical protein